MGVGWGVRGHCGLSWQPVLGPKCWLHPLLSPSRCSPCLSHMGRSWGSREGKKEQMLPVRHPAQAGLLGLGPVCVVGVLLTIGCCFFKKKICLFGCARSRLQPVGPLVVACGIQLPDQGWNLGPLHWEQGVSATGPPGRPCWLFLFVC